MQLRWQPAYDTSVGAHRHGLCDKLAGAARLHTVGRQDPGWVEDATL